MAREAESMASTYKQSFKQNYTDNVDISIYNCGLQSCCLLYTSGKIIRAKYIHFLMLRTVFTPFVLRRAALL